MIRRGLSLLALAAFALAPLASAVGAARAAAGSAPDGAAVLIVALCNGGAIAVPLGRRGEEKRKPERDRPGDCDFKACHAGECRKRFELARGPFAIAAR